MANAPRAYTQDYIARIRYSNALPPPPLAPKLLDIPNTGLASGQYTGAAYASRLAREQPLNIEADAELGMPIDLVGLKGVFDGDESVIQFEDNPPPIDPKDRLLLRPLNTLGKPMSITSGVSFLRRTEYITSAQQINRDGRNATLRVATPKKRRRADPSKDDPINIIRSIVKGFDLAYPRDAYTGPDSAKNVRGSEISQEEREAWVRPKHPSKQNVTLLDSYPILPDLEAFPDTGNYMVIKYMNNPSTNEKYDPRLDVALIRPLEQNEEESARYEERALAAQADPTLPKPIPEFRYETFLPHNSTSVHNIKRKYSTIDSEKDSDDLFDETNPDTGAKSFRYKRLRAYETYAQAGNPDDAWNDNVAMVLHDPELATDRKLPKAAYLYPVIQRTSIRTVRPKTIGMMGQSQFNTADDDQKVDIVDLVVRDPTEEEKDRVRDHAEKIDPVSLQRSVE